MRRISTPFHPNVGCLGTNVMAAKERKDRKKGNPRCLPHSHLCAACVLLRRIIALSRFPLEYTVKEKKEPRITRRTRMTKKLWKRFSLFFVHSCIRAICGQKSNGARPPVPRALRSDHSPRLPECRCLNQGHETCRHHGCVTWVRESRCLALCCRWLDGEWLRHRAAALDSLSQELGPAHLTHVCDVTDADVVAVFASSACRHAGPPDLLLNNAATINPNKPLWEVTAEEFARVIDVNLKGVHLILRAFCLA